MIEVDLTAHQAMWPAVADVPAVAEQLHGAALIGAADIDQRAVQRGVQIEHEVHRRSPPA